MSYDQLSAHAAEIYEKAIEDYLFRHYSIYKRGDLFYSPQRNSGYGVDWSEDTVYDEQELKAKIAEAEQKFADVTTMFNDFGGLPDPSAFDGPVKACNDVMTLLSSGAQTADPVTGTFYPANTALVGMTTAADYLDEWDGVAAMTFMENFVVPFDKVTLNQFTVASILKNALRAEQELWTHARKNIDTIAEDTIKALDHMHDCGKNEWEMAFSVVGAVVAISALTAATGGAAAFALGAAAASIDVASTYAGHIEDPPEPRFSGESAEAVVNSCRRAVEDLKTYIEQAEQKVASAMSNAGGTVADNREDFVSPRPRLADATHSTGLNDIGRPDSD